jgi:hypothetical protein
MVWMQSVLSEGSRVRAFEKRLHHADSNRPPRD